MTGTEEALWKRHGEERDALYKCQEEELAPILKRHRQERDALYNRQGEERAERGRHE